MGYMDISITGSDCASETHDGAVLTLLKYYEKQLKNAYYDNEWNTPAAINVAMSMNTIGKEFWLESIYWLEDTKFLHKLDLMLEQVMDACKEYCKDSDNDDNSLWHMAEYGKIIRKWRKIKTALLEKLEEELYS